ncbi:MAG TPA: hypothetical protein VNA69_14530 [Thermoanaerobaculia bacterium]|nr:hypothetical protein [Thermoanaerobaculia bacterium]
MPLRAVATGRFLAGLGKPGLVILDVIARRQEIVELPKRADSIVAISSSGRHLALTTQEGDAILLEHAKESGSIKSEAGAVQTGAFSRDGSRIVTGADEGVVDVWTARGQKVVSLAEEGPSVIGITFVGARRAIAACTVRSVRSSGIRRIGKRRTGSGSVQQA